MLAELAASNSIRRWLEPFSNLFDLFCRLGENVVGIVVAHVVSIDDNGIRLAVTLVV